MTDNFFCPLTADDMDRSDAIVHAVPGWSGREHYSFFKHAIVELKARKIIMLGVYFGRDICMILDVAARYGVGVVVNGIDKFTDTPCDDWTPEQKVDGHWQSNGFGLPPNYTEALAHILRYKHEPSNCFLFPYDDSSCLNDPVFYNAGPYDLIYLDTAHDYATVARQLTQCKPLVRAGGWIAGDDYVDTGTWGVRSAVNDGTVKHVAKDRIWIAHVEDVK